MNDEQTQILDLLRRDPASNKLVRDGGDNRWYVYELGDNPPTITDVRGDVGDALLTGGHVRYVEDEVRRTELPDIYSVYELSSEGGNE